MRFYFPAIGIKAGVFDALRQLGIKIKVKSSKGKRGMIR